MPYLGRFRQGDEIYVVQQTTRQGTLIPTIPIAAPFYQVWLSGSPSVRVVDSRMAAYQPALSNGVFRLSTFFGNMFATTGNYFVVVNWIDENNVVCQALHTFELMPGGDANGAIITMAEVVRPDARYILTTMDSGRLIRHKNPR